jgi:ketosteroid isomerase-like protein
MFTKPVLISVLVVVLAVPGMAQERREVPEFRTYGEPASNLQVAAIETALRRYRESWASQNTAAFMALHSDDTEWINAYARIFRGVEPLSDFIENRLFPAFSSLVSREEIANMRPISIRYLSGESVVVHLYTDGSRGQSRNEAEEYRRTHVHLVFDRRGDEWQIVHTVIMDAR